METTPLFDPLDWFRQRLTKSTGSGSPPGMFTSSRPLNSARRWLCPPRLGVNHERLPGFQDGRPREWDKSLHKLKVWETKCWFIFNFQSQWWVDWDWDGLQCCHLRPLIKNRRKTGLEWVHLTCTATHSSEVEWERKRGSKPSFLGSPYTFQHITQERRRTDARILHDPQNRQPREEVLSLCWNI